MVGDIQFCDSQTVMVNCLEGVLVIVEYIKRDAQFIHGTPFIWLPSERDFHVPSCFPVAFIDYKDRNSSSISQSNNNHRQLARSQSDRRDPPDNREGPGYRRTESYSGGARDVSSSRRQRDNTRRDRDDRGGDRPDSGRPDGGRPDGGRDRPDDDYRNGASYGRRDRNDSSRDRNYPDRRKDYDRFGAN